MDVSHLDLLPRFNTIAKAEKVNLGKTINAPLSGYLGGINKAGYYVTQLQEKWCEAFGCKYAIACNSATSGLLAACMAIGVGPGTIVWTTAYSMSATAACAKVLGAHIVFTDIETKRFSIDSRFWPGTTPLPKCVIVTNLFGHPAYLKNIRSWCDSNNVIMIEDAAQSPFAKEGNAYAGTVGHIGVFSLNTHKQIQAGEGGVIVTNDSSLAQRLHGAINHGEISGDIEVGLNLRMTEPTAAIACVQLLKAPIIIKERIELAETLTDMVKDIPWIRAPKVADGCVSVFYIWAALIYDPQQKRRYGLVHGLNERGFPMKAGYTRPLHGIFGVNVNLPVVQRVEYKELITFEVCSWSPLPRHIKKMREIIKEVAGAMT